jgi:class 3 adenylate cyclase
MAEQAQLKRVEAGREAIDRHDWGVAYDLLSEADAVAALEPVDLERLADAAWWTAHLDESIAARERAYSGRIAAGEPLSAAGDALTLAHDYAQKAADAIATAWMRRAERLLENEPEAIEHGWLERLRNGLAIARGDWNSALEHARRAYAIAEARGDRQLLAVALHDQGRALVLRGDVEEGLPLMEEATVPAVAGELNAYNTAIVYCNTITACTDLTEFRRAGDWAEAAKRWCERNAVAGFPGMCRVYRASIMRVRGALDEAEQEAMRAVGELPTFNVALAAEAFYELGEIRLRTGDLAGAAEGFRQAHELGRDPQPGLARLRLLQGKAEGAETCIVRALETETRDLSRARLLPVRVEVALARGDLDAARVAVEELEAIAERYGSDALRAAAASARAALLIAEDANAEAVGHALRAIRLWQSADAPYDAARARTLLAEAYAALGADDDAALELGAAAAAYERVGVEHELRAARDSLARLESRRASGNGRRSVRTFMFTDIVRSTDLVAAIGDEAWLDLVRWHDGTLRSLFVEHGGEEVDHAGDGFFVAFGDAGPAIDCAVSIQRTLADHRRRNGFAPQVRIGLHATEAEADGDAYRGRGVHEAARISSIAGGGEIVASRVTVDGRTELSLTDPREVDLKGIEKPVELVTVGWR